MQVDKSVYNFNNVSGRITEINALVPISVSLGNPMIKLNSIYNEQRKELILIRSHPEASTKFVGTGTKAFQDAEIDYNTTNFGITYSITTKAQSFELINSGLASAIETWLDNLLTGTTIKDYDLISFTEGNKLICIVAYITE